MHSNCDAQSKREEQKFERQQPCRWRRAATHDAIWFDADELKIMQHAQHRGFTSWRTCHEMEEVMRAPECGAKWDCGERESGCAFGELCANGQ